MSLLETSIWARATNRLSPLQTRLNRPNSPNAHYVIFFYADPDAACFRLSESEKERVDAETRLPLQFIGLTGRRGRARQLLYCFTSIEEYWFVLL